MESKEYPKIYSKSTIWWFSLFFSSIFGGILFMQNLKDFGRKREANIVLLLLVIYTAMAGYIANIPYQSKFFLAIFFNLAGGGFMTTFFYNKYIPLEERYEKKKIWKPLIISVLVSLVIPLGFDLFCR